MINDTMVAAVIEIIVGLIIYSRQKLYVLYSSSKMMILPDLIENNAVAFSWLFLSCVGVVR